MRSRRAVASADGSSGFSGDEQNTQKELDASERPAVEPAESGAAARARRTEGDEEMRGISKSMAMGLSTAGVVLGLVGGAPSIAVAARTCNGLLTIDYVAGPNFAIPGDVVRVRLTLGTGSIQGGTKLTVNRLRFDLDCNSNFTLGIPCTDEGPIIEYEGDSTITSNCPNSVTWSTGHAVGSSPNEVVFTPSSPVMIPAGQSIPPGFCMLEFD